MPILLMKMEIIKPRASAIEGTNLLETLKKTLKYIVKCKIL